MTSIFPSIRKEIIRPKSSLERTKLIFQLRKKYDVVFDLYGSPYSSVLSRIASKNITIGFAHKRFSSLYNFTIEDNNPLEHTINVNLKLLKPLNLNIPENISIDFKSNLEKVNNWKKRITENAAIIHAGGRFTSKILQPEKFDEVASHLKKIGYNVFFLYGPGDKVPAILKKWEELHNVPASELPYLFQAASLFIGSDSGPMHFAAAAGCKVIALFGPSSPYRWKPYGNNARIIEKKCKCGYGWQKSCRYPDEWCIGKITSEEIISKVKML